MSSPGTTALPVLRAAGGDRRALASTTPSSLESGPNLLGPCCLRARLPLPLGREGRGFYQTACPAHTHMDLGSPKGASLAPEEAVVESQAN